MNMPLFAIVLMFLTAVILIVSLTYIISTNRTKEKLALLERGLDPKDYIKDRFFLNSMKAGILLLGIGSGFLTAVLLDEYVFTSIDNPGIYPGCIGIMAGISLIIYYRIYNKHESDNN